MLIIRQYQYQSNMLLFIYFCKIILCMTKIQDYLMAEHKVSQSKAGLLASVVGGLFAAVPSHPFDVVKTCMQQDIKQQKYTTFSNTVQILYKEV
jgi:hypothetical protein